MLAEFADFKGIAWLIIPAVLLALGAALAFYFRSYGKQKPMNFGPQGDQVASALDGLSVGHQTKEPPKTPGSGTPVTS